MEKIVFPIQGEELPIGLFNLTREEVKRVFLSTLVSDPTGATDVAGRTQLDEVPLDQFFRRLKNPQRDEIDGRYILQGGAAPNASGDYEVIAIIDVYVITIALHIPFHRGRVAVGETIDFLLDVTPVSTTNHNYVWIYQRSEHIQINEDSSFSYSKNVMKNIHEFMRHVPMPLHANPQQQLRNYFVASTEILTLFNFLLDSPQTDASVQNYALNIIQFILFSKLDDIDKVFTLIYETGLAQGFHINIMLLKKIEIALHHIFHGRYEVLIQSEGSSIPITVNLESERGMGTYFCCQKIQLDPSGNTIATTSLFSDPQRGKAEYWTLRGVFSVFPIPIAGETVVTKHVDGDWSETLDSYLSTEYDGTTSVEREERQQSRYEWRRLESPFHLRLIQDTETLNKSFQQFENVRNELLHSTLVNGLYTRYLLEAYPFLVEGWGTIARRGAPSLSTTTPAMTTPAPSPAPSAPPPPPPPPGPTLTEEQRRQLEQLEADQRQLELDRAVLERERSELDQKIAELNQRSATESATFTTERQRLDRESERFEALERTMRARETLHEQQLLDLATERDRIAKELREGQELNEANRRALEERERGLENARVELERKYQEQKLAFDTAKRQLEEENIRFRAAGLKIREELEYTIEYLKLDEEALEREMADANRNIAILQAVIRRAAASHEDITRILEEERKRYTTVTTPTTPTQPGGRGSVQRRRPTPLRTPPESTTPSTPESMERARRRLQQFVTPPGVVLPNLPPSTPRSPQPITPSPPRTTTTPLRVPTPPPSLQQKRGPPRPRSPPPLRPLLQKMDTNRNLTTDIGSRLGEQLFGTDHISYLDFFKFRFIEKVENTLDLVVSPFIFRETVSLGHVANLLVPIHRLPGRIATAPLTIKWYHENFITDEDHVEWRDRSSLRFGSVEERDAGLYRVSVRYRKLVENLPTKITLIGDLQLCVVAMCRRCGRQFEVSENEHGACQWHSKHIDELWSNTSLAMIDGEHIELPTKIGDVEYERTPALEVLQTMNIPESQRLIKRLPRLVEILKRVQFQDFSPLGEVRGWWVKPKKSSSSVGGGGGNNSIASLNFTASLGGTLPFTTRYQYYPKSEREQEERLERFDVNQFVSKAPLSVLFSDRIVIGLQSVATNEEKQFLQSLKKFQLNEDALSRRARKSISTQPYDSTSPLVRNPHLHQGLSRDGTTWQCCGLPRSHCGCWQGRHSARTTIPDFSNIFDYTINRGVRPPTTSLASWYIHETDNEALWLELLKQFDVFVQRALDVKFSFNFIAIEREINRRVGRRYLPNFHLDREAERLLIAHLELPPQRDPLPLQIFSVNPENGEKIRSAIDETRESNDYFWTFDPKALREYHPLGPYSRRRDSVERGFSIFYQNLSRLIREFDRVLASPAIQLVKARVVDERALVKQAKEDAQDREREREERRRAEEKEERKRLAKEREEKEKEEEEELISPPPPPPFIVTPPTLRIPIRKVPIAPPTTLVESERARILDVYFNELTQYVTNYQTEDPNFENVLRDFLAMYDDWLRNEIVEDMSEFEEIIVNLDEEYYEQK